MSWGLRLEWYREPFYGTYGLLFQESVSSLVSTESLAFIMDCEFRVRCRYHCVYLIGRWNGVNGRWYAEDRMSMTEIDAMVKELGHEGLINYWYSIPGDSFDGDHEDADVLDMLVFVPDTRLKRKSRSRWKGKELNEEGLIDEASKQGKETATVNNEENSDKGQEKPSQGCSDKGKGKDKDMSHRVKRAFGRVDGVRTEFQRHSMMLRSGRRLANAANFEDEDDDASDSEDSNYMIPKNFSEDKDEDDVFFNEWVDDQTEWTWVKETGNEVVPDWPTDVELDSKDYECKDYAKYNYDEEVDKNWLKFNAATDMVDPKFDIGILFSDCKVFRAAVREYSILQNKDVVFIRNEALKLKAVCGDPNCGWMIYASKMQHENTLQVKTYIVRSFKQTVEKDYNIGVSRQQVYRAKDKALKLIEGSFNE
ncbi:unnamed protein product [Prunus armeniaca]|uniref:Transposase MuDR plant domain-containing protein n=1 Tax=Prunus armeniaca TaxID=36596 RepID=A0A6J5V1U4_PRUAR|nr:unnamed protein product [Prunus armeniaca]